jgi:hypothetical protein
LIADSLEDFFLGGSGVMNGVNTCLRSTFIAYMMSALLEEYGLIL